MVDPSPSKTRIESFLAEKWVTRSRKDLAPTVMSSVEGHGQQRDDGTAIGKVDVNNFNVHNNLGEQEENAHIVLHLISTDTAQQLVSRDTSQSNISRPGIIAAIVVSIFMGTLLLIYIFIRKRHRANGRSTFPSLFKSKNSSGSRSRTKGRNQRAKTSNFRVGEHRYAAKEFNHSRSDTFVSEEPRDIEDDENLVRYVINRNMTPSSVSTEARDKRKIRDTPPWLQEKSQSPRKTATTVSSKTLMDRDNPSPSVSSNSRHITASKAGPPSESIDSGDQYSIMVAQDASRSASFSSSLKPPPLQIQKQQKQNPKMPPGSSWLLLSPSASSVDLASALPTRQNTIKSELRTPARSSRVTIPSYCYTYYRKFFNQNGSRIQSQFYPESPLEGESWPVHYNKEIYLEEDPGSPYSEDDRYSMSIKSPTLPSKPAQAARSPTERNKDIYDPRRNKDRNRQTICSIATASTAPVFKQHPGDRIDL